MEVVHLHGSDMQQCRTCKVVKPARVFGRKENNKSGKSSTCVECHRARDKKRYRDHTPRRKETAKWAALKFNFGLSRDQWSILLQAQNYRCAICESTFVLESRRSRHNPCVDHDHATGVVRGLLCRTCNQGIGLLQDDSEVAAKAAAYLKRHGK